MPITDHMISALAYICFVLQAEVNDDSGDEVLDCKEIWRTTSCIKEISKSPLPSNSVQKLKQTANHLLSQGQYEQAIQCYTACIEDCSGTDSDSSQLAILHSNRALAHIKSGCYAQVVNPSSSIIAFHVFAMDIS